MASIEQRIGALAEDYVNQLVAERMKQEVEAGAREQLGVIRRGT